jgi:uncharacterized protein YndB with AHSA1/START domain
MAHPKRVDVAVRRQIAASPERVARVMFDAAREPEWMKAVSSAGWADAEVRVGSRAWQKGRFLGKEIGWTTEVTEYEPSRLLTMRIDQGPFQGIVSYLVEPNEGGSRVTVRNAGAPTAFAWMPRWLIQRAMHTAMSGDLARLQRLAEEPHHAREQNPG